MPGFGEKLPLELRWQMIEIHHEELAGGGANALVRGP